MNLPTIFFLDTGDANGKLTCRVLSSYAFYLS